LDAQKLAVAAAGKGLTGEVAANVGEALARARELAGPADMIFVGGSSFVVADALAETDM
jgi:dihydrofolate synthase/folylpolyglutamate synthase